MTKIHTKRNQKMQRLNFTVDPVAAERLNWLKAFYRQHLKATPSISLIVRRGLEALQAEISPITDDKEIQTETLNLLKQAG